MQSVFNLFSFIFSITYNQLKLFLHLPIKRISKITQETQIIRKKDQLLSYLIILFQKNVFSKGKLNAKCIQFALSFIFSITNENCFYISL